MKISVNWMQKLAGDVKIMPNGIDDLVQKIGAQLGAVEEVIDLGKKYQGIVIAKVVECKKHPNADKLQVCKIDDGGKTKSVKRDKDGYVQVVCGAPNVREGLFVAWLPPSTTVPSSFDKDPFVLEARELRGVVSNGMLASAHELAIGDDHNGILEIENSREQRAESREQKKIALGDDFAKTYGLDDYIIDIENKMFTHRPDCFGILGVARELAGIQQTPYKSPKWYSQEPKFPKIEASELKFKVKNSVPKLVPRFTATAMSSVTVGPSPTWLQVALEKVGSRSINNIVDYTNYFMLLTGQPLHAYDADKLPAPSLETRMSKKGEKLKLLSGKELKFEDDTTVLITSGDIPVGIGGVMGGADTEVDENTKNIVIECANFDMYSIRRTSMKYGLFTDAVTRFNKGQSPLQNLVVLVRIVDEIRQFAGGKVASKLFDDDHSTKKSKMIRVSAQFINERLGLALAPDEIQDLLTNVEFEIERSDNRDELKITPPFWRTDIDIPEDIVEEVGRLHGYDHLPLVLPFRSLSPVNKDELLTFKQKLRAILANSGANELLTYSFVHGNLLDAVGQDRKRAFELKNALSPDLQYYRMDLLPSLLDKVHANTKAGYDEFAIFELNKAHNKLHADDDAGLPTEFNMLALVYSSIDKQKRAGSAYFEARKYLDVLAETLGIELVYAPAKEMDYPVFKPYDISRTALVTVKNTDIALGLIGEFKQSVIKNLKLPQRTAGFEIGTKELLQATQNISKYKPIPKYPKVTQDISLKVSADLQFADLFNFLQDNLRASKHAQTKWETLDIYQGDDKKHKNITLRLTIASFEKTMTASEVNKLLDDVAVLAHDKLSAERL